MKYRVACKHRQRGYLLSIELALGLQIFLLLLYLLFDFSQFYQHRERLQQAAFAVASVAANQSAYYDGNLLTQGNTRQAAEWNVWRNLAARLLVTDAAGVNLVVQQFHPDDASKRVTLGQGCAVGNGPDLDVPVIRVSLCVTESWGWFSGGFSQSMVNRINAEGLVVQALLPVR